MIQTSATMRILVAVQPVDFRKGIDGLAAVCRQQLAQDPLSGWAFIFRNRRATAVKILAYDGQGFWLCQKRLSKGRFQWWPEAGADRTVTLAVHELQLLFWNGNPRQAQVAPVWKKVDSGR